MSQKSSYTIQSPGISQRINMDRWEGKVAVVTGANGGMGSAITAELVKAGISVVGLDRRLDNLEKLASSLNTAKGKFYARQCDVRKEEDLLNAFKWVNAELGGVDILVNNAGVAKVSRIIDDDVDSFRNILEVNVLAMAIAIREAVASMKSRDVPGYIVNINSVVGHGSRSTGMHSLYGPSKHAVTAITETVRRELASEANNKIKITSISPGLVKTGIHEASGYTDLDNLLKENPYLDPEDIAGAVLYLLGTRQKVQVTELTIRPTGETLGSTM